MVIAKSVGFLTILANVISILSSLVPQGFSDLVLFWQIEKM